MENNVISIGTIASYYGCLTTYSSEDGKYYWGIENYDGTEWEEIPESLYNELVRFEDFRNGKRD